MAKSKKTEPKTYRLGSSSEVHTPGVIAWAINGYQFEDDREVLLRIVASSFPSVPKEALKQLLSKSVEYTVEDETVVFTVEI